MEFRPSISRVVFVGNVIPIALAKAFRAAWAYATITTAGLHRFFNVLTAVIAASSTTFRHC
jgi:hypothetical protein